MNSKLRNGQCRGKGETEKKWLASNKKNQIGPGREEYSVSLMF